MIGKLTGEGADEEADVKKNVWKSDKSWEPGKIKKIWKLENLKFWNF